MSQVSEALVFPTVSIDRSYGGLVDSIEVDFESITAHLRAKGMTDKEIQGLSIHFASKTTREASGDDRYRLYGQYFGSYNAIEMYRPDDLSSFTGPISADSKDIMNINTDKKATDETTSYLVHELEHFILDDHEETEALEKAHRDSMKNELIKKGAVLTLGSLALGITASAGLYSTVVIPRLQALDSLIEKGASDAEIYTEGAITAAFWILGVAIVGLSGWMATRNLRKTLDTIRRKQYKNSPEEIKARHAAEVYDGQPMVTFVAKKERIGDLTPIIATLLGKFGEFEATTDGPAASH